MSLQTSIDAVAKAVALVDVHDLTGLVALQELLLKLASEAADAQFSRVSDASAHAAQIVEHIVLREVDDTAAALRTLGEAVEFAQRVKQADERGDTIGDIPSPFDQESTCPDLDEPVVINALASDSIGEFLAEAREHLANAEAAILRLERNPTESDEVNTVFRCFHTIKGVAGFMSLDPVVEVAHAAESLLDRARNGTHTIGRQSLDLMLAGCDMLTRMVGQLDGGAAPTKRQVRHLIERLTAAADGKLQPATPDPRGATKGSSGAPTPPVSSASQRAEPTVKVSTLRMDSLLNMVGELVIAQLMVQQDPVIARVTDDRVRRKLAHLTNIVRDLRDTAMGLRIVTLKATFQKVSRAVRDVSARTNRRLELVLMGEDTELDRAIVEAIADPLVHLVRNACDHGIEDEAERRRKGKNPCGTLSLRAFHRGGMVVIEVADDGRGLQREKILAKCVERGLIPADRNHADISDAEVYSHIFLPGFSTADAITDISGRGVGMDVVKRNVEALHGTIEVRSAPGEGSTVVMQLPLTLAIIDGMLVRVGAQRYVVPTRAIERTVRPRPEEIHALLGTGEMARVRDRLLPILRLNRLFALREGTESLSEGLLLVVESGKERYCLFVDEILGQQQVVIKSLGGGIADCGHPRSGVAGGAILGDGQVALILDVGALLRIVPHLGAA